MSTHKNVIEINGKIYDAKSGTLLVGNIVRPSKQAIDSIIVTKKASASEVVSSKSSTEVAKKPSKVRPLGHQIKHRTPQRSQTLMRRAVKKPAPAHKPAEIHTFKQTHTHHSRTERAQATKKNPFINKFSTHDHQVTKRIAPLKVVHPPTTKQPPAEHKTAVKKPAPAHKPHVSESEKLFNSALERVHTAEPKHKSQKRRAKRLGSRVLHFGSAGLGILLLLGFIVYMNLPNLNMQLASTRAGFNANLPRYQPSGYSMTGPIDFSPGKVTVDFKSNTDDRSYTITQEISKWTSQALQENFLAARNKRFETTQDEGKTIFLYDNGNATWVNGGIWYQVESDALSSDQLIKIASSL